MMTNRRKTERDVGEELQFHVDMLEMKYAQHGMSTAEAKAAAQKRFGNIERVTKQCVAISRRNSAFTRILKTFLILVGLAGLAIKIFSSDTNVARIGGVLIMIAIAGRLLLYVRGLIPSTTARN
jgi:hypothetical protein